MKTIFKIVGLLSIVAVIFFALGIGLRMGHESAVLEELESLGQVAGPYVGLESHNLENSMIISFITIAIGLMAIVSVWMKGKTYRLLCAGLIAALPVITYTTVPVMEGGRDGGLDPHISAFIVMVTGLLAALSLIGLFLEKRKEDAALRKGVSRHQTGALDGGQ